MGAAFVVLAWGVWPSFMKLGVDINRYVFFADRGISTLYFAFLLFVRGLGVEKAVFVEQWAAAVFILPFALQAAEDVCGGGGVGQVLCPGRCGASLLFEL
jgi:hypothetical protein